MSQKPSSIVHAEGKRQIKENCLEILEARRTPYCDVYWAHDYIKYEELLTIDYDGDDNTIEIVFSHDEIDGYPRGKTKISVDTKIRTQLP